MLWIDMPAPRAFRFQADSLKRRPVDSEKRDGGHRLGSRQRPAMRRGRAAVHGDVASGTLTRTPTIGGRAAVARIAGHREHADVSCRAPTADLAAASLSARQAVG